MRMPNRWRSTGRSAQGSARSCRRPPIVPYRRFGVRCNRRPLAVRVPYSVIDIPTKQPPSEPSSVPGIDPGVLQRFPRHPHRDPLLRVHHHRLVMGEPKKGGSNVAAPSKNPPESQTRRQPSSTRDAESRSSTVQPRSRGNGPSSSLDSASADHRALGLSIPPGASTAIPEMTIGSVALPLRQIRCCSRRLLALRARRQQLRDSIDVRFEIKVPAVEHRHLDGVGVITPPVEIAQGDVSGPGHRPSRESEPLP